MNDREKMGGARDTGRQIGITITTPPYHRHHLSLNTSMEKSLK
jgi:hypothetical protein